MKLTVLGSCGGYPEPGRACSGFLIQSDTTAIWVDTGTGTLDALLRVRPLEQIDGIILSHLHPDHWTDLPIALHQLAVISGGRVEQPVPVFGPAGWQTATGVASQWFSAQSPPFLAAALEPGTRFEIGDMTISPAEVQHSVPTFALRFTDGDAVIAYSADTSPCEAVQQIAEGADLFLCESTLPAETETAISMNPAQAGQTASAASVRQLVLTHLLPGLDPAESCTVARKHFAGPVVHADPGRVFEV